MLEDLKETVCRANVDLANGGLVTLTFGNTSGIDRERGLVVIKPSGVPYDQCRAEDMVVLDLEGKTVEGKLKPSTDAPSHLELYRAWPRIGGVSHTHSPYATMFAQALKPLPCLGTTHADHFRGEVPVTRVLTREEIEKDYEKNTGAVIVERFRELDPLDMPGVLVAGHGPFAWGRDPEESVTNSLALEICARMALGSMLINPDVAPIPEHLLEKHFTRKHGASAYYGQKKK